MTHPPSPFKAGVVVPRRLGQSDRYLFIEGLKTGPTQASDEHLNSKRDLSAGNQYTNNELKKKVVRVDLLLC